MESSKTAFWLALVAIVIATGGYFYPQALFGEIGTRWPNGVYIGSQASQVPLIRAIDFGTCSLIAPSYTVAASTTVAMDCAATGALATDVNIIAQFATSTATGAGWLITGVSASSTADFLTLRVANNTGASAVIPASLASSTPWFIIR